MNGREWLVLLLFGGFFFGTVGYIFAMLERKKKEMDLDRDRLIFFFLACLMLVCLVPVWLAKMLKIPVLVGNLCAVGSNLLGLALTYSRSAKADSAPQIENSAVRTYQVYFRGSPYAIVTREGFELLMEYELLKKQRTVELIDDYQRSARQQGVTVQLLKNEDGSQTLIKVEVPE
tara:strand:+ start:224 stop:748 length:525 start_codon:yes stop_codon:yes gene_type:complete